MESNTENGKVISSPIEVVSIIILALNSLSKKSNNAFVSELELIEDFKDRGFEIPEIQLKDTIRLLFAYGVIDQYSHSDKGYIGWRISF